LIQEANSLSTEIGIINQDLLTATGSNLQGLEEAKVVKTENLNERLNDATNLRDEIKQVRLQQANYLLAINQYLEPEYVYQSNDKIINQIFLETIGQDIFEFTSHQQSIVNSIANQCVTEGGRGVVRARALQQFYITKYYEDDYGCGIKPNGRIDDDQEKQIISVYPNPSEGNFVIQFEYPIEENLELEFYDLNGKLLFQDKLVRGTFNYTFKDKVLESGVYICKLKSASFNVLTQKVVINKF